MVTHGVVQRPACVGGREEVGTTACWQVGLQAVIRAVLPGDTGPG